MANKDLEISADNDDFLTNKRFNFNKNEKLLKKFSSKRKVLSSIVNQNGGVLDEASEEEIAVKVFTFNSNAYGIEFD